MSQLIELLKNFNYQIPKVLLFNYKRLNISETELIFIIYLLNQNSNSYNPKQVGNDLNYDLKDVLEIINFLCEKKVIKIELKKINNISNEVINFDMLYEKLAFSIEDKSENTENNIYALFENEFGRTLSPMEYEIISGWIDGGFSEDIIKLALKEAAYNGINNLRYIDKIIYEWNKKGIKTKEDVENNRKQFKKSNDSKKDLFDYDWLNDEDNS